MSELKTTLQIAADGTQAVAGITGVKKAAQDMQQAVVKGASDAAKAVDSLSASAGRAGDGFTGQAKRFLNSLQQNTIAVTQGKAAAAAFKAEQLGVAEAAAPYVEKLKAAAETTHEFSLNNSMARTELGRLAVDLANGNFGRFQQTAGVLANATGLMGAAFSLAGLAIGGVTAAIGAVAYAMLKGSSETTKFNTDLTLTGGIVGKSASQMSDLATSIGNVAGSRSDAVKTLDELASSGKFTADNIERIGTAIVEMHDVSGQSIEELATQFESLGDKPAEAIVKLNDQYHFLTASVYEQIASLQEQGRTQDAVRLAQDTYAQAVQQRAQEIKAQLGTIPRLWDDIKSAASKAWDAMMGLGRPDSISDLQAKLAAIDKRIEQGGGAGRASGFGDTGGGAAAMRPNFMAQLLVQRQTVAEQLRQLQNDEVVASGKAQVQLTQDVKIGAQQRIDALKKETESNAQRRAKEIAQVQKDAASLGLTAQQTAELISQINEKYKDPTVKAYQDDAGTKMLMSLREQAAALEEQLNTEGKATTQAQARAKFEQQIADIKTKSVLTADQKSLLANQGAIEAQLDINVALDKQLAYKQALQKLDERSAQIAASNAEALRSQNEQYAREEGAFGQGTQEQQRIASEQSIRNRFDREGLELAKAAKDGTLSSPDYAKAQEDLQTSLNAQLKALQDHYSRIDDLQSNWELGFDHAWSDYVDAAKNAYQQAGDVFKTVTSGMEDLFVSFAQTGKLSFKDLADSIIADMARIAAKQAISGLGNLVAGLFGPVNSVASGVSLASSGTATSGAGLSGSWGAVVGGRASGGPVSAGSTYSVNERGDPELLSVGTKQYLMMGRQSGDVTPLKTLQGASQGGGAPDVTVNVVNQSSQSVAAKPGPVSWDRQLKKMVQTIILTDAQSNGPMIKGIKGAMV